MGKRAEMEQVAIQLYAEGKEIPQISIELEVSENSLREWKKRAGNEWDEARAVCRKAFLAGMESVGSRLSRSRDIAATITGDAKNQGKVGLVLNQAIQTMIYDIIGQLQTVEILDAEAMTASIEQVKGLSLILQRSEASAALNLKREADIRKLTLEQAAETVEKTAKLEGVSAEAILRIRRDVLMMAG
jgi:hypothetical protein